MIHAKLLEFQKKNIKVERDSANPHFRSRYTSLNEVLDKVKGPLNDLGVVIVQRPDVSADGQTHFLRTILLDTEDDTEVECFVPFVGATDMQKLGGAITYARRYSLVTLLGLEDEDDDGNAASAPKPVAKAVARESAVKEAQAKADNDPFAGLEQPF